MKTRPDDVLFNLLVEICSKINEQIPLAANRFEEFECFPIDPSISDAEREKLIKEAEKRYAEHESEYVAAQVRYSIYTELNNLFDTFLRENQVTDPAKLSAKQQRQFEERLPTEAESLFTRISRRFKYVSEISLPDVSQVKDFLDKNASRLAQTLLSGKHLTLENNDFAHRLALNERLAELRMSYKNLALECMKELDSIDPDMRQDIEKVAHIRKGFFLQQTKASVGYCDEHTTLALVMLLQTAGGKKETCNIIIEKIILQYITEEGKLDGNHTFLIINRDPASQLNDMSSWGDKAIILDPWNRLVCYAQDYKKLSKCYLSFPSSGKWHAEVTYNQDDLRDTDYITDLDIKYAITGNSKLEDRIPRLMEEFELISLEAPSYRQTKDYLYRLAQVTRPANYEFNAEIFLTTNSADLITIIPGFAEPKIAVHANFIHFSDEELRFGLAQTQVAIQRNWAGMISFVSAEDQFDMDKRALAITQNGEAATRYLRRSISLSVNDRRNFWLPPIKIIEHSGMPSSDESRIKLLETLFASDDYAHLWNNEALKKETPVSTAIADEVKEIKPYRFFKENFDCFKGTVNKIRYLITCLPELHTELLPYEFEERASIRLHHFCNLLRSLPIDLNRPKQLAIVNQLINATWEAKTPGFAEIYCAVHGMTYNSLLSAEEAPPLRPLGLFADLQSAITCFVQADTMQTVKTAAEDIQQLLALLKNHFDDAYNSTEFWHKHYKQTPGHHPTGMQRYVGSTLGKFVAITGFDAFDDDHLPWLKHVSYAHEDKTSVIAHTLWCLGLNHYEPLWSAFTSDVLLRLIHAPGEHPILFKVTGITSYTAQKYDSLLFTTIESYIEKNHPWQTTMFDSVDFKEAVKLYCEVNWLLLKNPGRNKSAGNNKAVQFLLDQFAQVAQSGSNAEREVVKQFFFGTAEQPSLNRLMSEKSSTRLDYSKSPYMQFMFDQQFNDRTFKLFQTTEITDYFIKEIESKRVRGIYLNILSLPPVKYMALYEVPYAELSLDCMETILPLMHKTRFGHSNPFFSEYFSKYQPLAFSNEAMRLIRLLPLGSGIDVPHMNIIHSDQLNWKIPVASEYSSLTEITDLIFLYRHYDSRFLFPTIQIKLQVSGIIEELLNNITNVDDKIAALEALLLQTQITLPLSDMSLRTKAIEMWVAAILIKYGKDDGTEEYQRQLRTVINRMLANTANRDATTLFGKFAAAIEAQWKISEYLGEQLDGDHYFLRKNQDKKNMLAQLSAFSGYFNESEEDQHRFLNLLSEPLTDESLTDFFTYVKTHKNINTLFAQLGLSINYSISHEKWLSDFLHTFYYIFWDLPLEQRAVLIDHVLIPAEKVKTEKELAAAYQCGFEFVAAKLLPNADNADSDDHLAKAILKAYLDTADQYTRNLLLAGMLVASNECANADQPITVGKKIVMLCEHMGPAYIKLAQAIHSHPRTPEHLLKDLENIKSKANPPYRWQLWRLIQCIPIADRTRIKRVGRLLGSASYNLALEIELTDGSKVVLSLLREHAARDANKGFKHLTATIQACDHPRLASSQDALVSILHEAEVSSKLEMDKEASIEQYAFANQCYTGISKSVSTPLRTYQIHFKPAKLLLAGEGYRFIDLVDGKEFNELPTKTPHDRHVRRAIASAVMEVELINMLSGGRFDRDRHGGQYKADIDEKTGTVVLGLYDYGEINLARPTRFEITQLAAIFAQLPARLWQELTVEKTMRTIISNDNSWIIPIIEVVISEHIELATKLHEPTMYLMGLRKAFLALHDFHKELSAKQMIDILQRVAEHPAVHPELAIAVKACLANDIFNIAISQTLKNIGDMLGSISKNIYGLFVSDVPVELAPLAQEASQEQVGHISPD